MLAMHEMEKRLLELESRVSALESNPAPIVEPNDSDEGATIKQEVPDVTVV